MSYCRIGEGSDVYLWSDGKDLHLDFGDKVSSYPVTKQGLILCRNKLNNLRKKGNEIPQRAIDRLEAEIAGKTFLTDVQIVMRELDLE